MISKDFQAIADRFVWDHEADIGKANLCEPVAAFDGVFGCMIIQTPPRDPATWKLRETQGDNTRTAADAALRDGGYDTLDDFVNGGGYDNARYSDQLQQAYHLVETGGPELKAAAEAAIVGDRKTLDEFITIEQYRRASLDANREAHNDHIDSMLATGRNIANLAGELASNAQAAYEYSRGSAQTARQYADAAAEYAGFAQQASQRAQEFAASAQQSLDFAKQQQARAHQAAASAAADAAEATANADQATSYAIDARASVNTAADSAISARASAAAAGQDAALAAQAADDAFRIAVEKALAEQAELQAGLDAQAADGADPEKPASLLDIIKERIGPAALSLLLDLVGVTDLVNCFKGQISGCLWTLVGVIPAAKIAKAAPIVRRLISKTDEIVDALHSRKTLKSRQLKEIRNLPACPAFRPASYSPAATFRPALQIRGAADLSLQTAARSKTCRIPSTPDKPFRGGPYRDLGTQAANNIGVQRHHILAKKVILDNPDLAAKFGIDQWNAPALTLIPADHIKTKSWGSFSYSDPYRKEQERLLREGNINEIFQIEYDFLTSPQFEGRYDQAIQEAIDYAFDQGMITKKPTPRAAGLEASTKDTQNGFYL